MRPGAPATCPPDGENSVLGTRGKVDATGGEYTECTLTLGSPSMSPDPGRKETPDSVSCLFFCGQVSKPTRIPHYFCAENLLSWQHLWRSSYVPSRGQWGRPGLAGPREAAWAGARGVRVRHDHRASARLPNDPFMWCGSMPPMPPIGPSEPGPIGNWGRNTGRERAPGPPHSSQGLPPPATNELCPRRAPIWLGSPVRHAELSAAPRKPELVPLLALGIGQGRGVLPMHQVRK